MLIVGAGISGIGAAYYLQRDHPGRSYAILEARGASGGTWDLFRYPGIRSDSDLHTFGYEFKPWRDGSRDRRRRRDPRYLRETAAEHGIDRHDPLPPQGASRAAWSTSEARWTVTVERTDTGERDDRHLPLAVLRAPATTATTRGSRPQFEGASGSPGTIVHPQHWPEDLDYAGKRVVVIGCGATAVTLVPAMADDAPRTSPCCSARRPTSCRARRGQARDAAPRLLGVERGYAVARWKNVARSRALAVLPAPAPGGAQG